MNSIKCNGLAEFYSERAETSQKQRTSALKLYFYFATLHYCLPLTESDKSLANHLIEDLLILNSSQFFTCQFSSWRFRLHAWKERLDHNTGDKYLKDTSTLFLPGFSSRGYWNNSGKNSMLLVFFAYDIVHNKVY